MEIEVIFEDSHIMVINKPSGLVVNNSQTSGDLTVQNMLSSSDEPSDEDEPSESEFMQRGGIVHRIDKDTSGILVVAKDEPSFKRLQKQFKRREVEKEYTALVLGHIPDDLIEIDAPIGRNPTNRLKYAVVDTGKEAQTRVEKVKEITHEDKNATLVSVFPKTGRTHQIRVHLAALGYPIIGDVIYCNKNQLDVWNPEFSRLMLHAKKITFTHPETGDRVSFEAPLPPEFMLY